MWVFDGVKDPLVPYEVELGSTELLVEYALGDDLLDID